MVDSDQCMLLKLVTTVDHMHELWSLIKFQVIVNSTQTKHCYYLTIVVSKTCCGESHFNLLDLVKH